ncbi:MAG: methyltransferase domain-containing protein [Clostridia bacterium]|nr:methyltransferase domain-containing protein [Clostridia bacterium]
MVYYIIAKTEREEMDNGYMFLPEYYDRLNSEVDYKAWAKDISEVFDKNGIRKGDLVLDLACGTGSITAELARLGYDMIGIDSSAGMLEAARRKAPDILWLNQDMRSFELYGTVKAVTCCLDSVNYLLKEKDLAMCFGLVHNYLEPGGIFVFDVNTRYKFEKVYADNHYILEDGDVVCCWRNHYSAKTGICDFDLTFFSGRGGTYLRTDEHQRERCWSDRTLKKVLSGAGFGNIRITSGLSSDGPAPDAERHFFVSECLK